LAPTILLSLTAIALLGSFFTHGFFNQVFVVFLLVPLYFVLRVLLTWLRERR
jgi:hypothetical protein